MSRSRFASLVALALASMGFSGGMVHAAPRPPAPRFPETGPKPVKTKVESRTRYGSKGRATAAQQKCEAKKERNVKRYRAACR